LKVGNDADDLAAIDFEALVVLVAEKDFADDLAQGRVVLDPATATVVGTGEMDPEPAIMGRDGAIDLFGRDQPGDAFGVEMIGGNDAGGGRAFRQGGFKPVHAQRSAVRLRPMARWLSSSHDSFATGSDGAGI
jgi:hypothetical protein